MAVETDLLMSSLGFHWGAQDVHRCAPTLALPHEGLVSKTWHSSSFRCFGNTWPCNIRGCCCHQPPQAQSPWSPRTATGMIL